MDYIKLTSDRLFDLVTLGNVVDPYVIKDILEMPAVSDILMEVTSPKWPKAVMCTHRLRTDVEMDLNVRDTDHEYVAGDGSHKPVEDSMKERITDCGVHMTSLTIRHISGELKMVSSLSTCMTAVKGGMDVIVDLTSDDQMRKSQYIVSFCQFVYRAWLELNWLIRNQPHTVHTGRAPADTIPAVRASDKKHKGRDKAKGRRRVYVRMLTLTGLDAALKEKEKVREEDLTSQTVLHVYTCPVWEVRGHMRHYKSGKTVYVAPYRKGKERDSASAVSGKEYVLTGGDHAGKN